MGISAMAILCACFTGASDCFSSILALWGEPIKSFVNMLKWIQSETCCVKLIQIQVYHFLFFEQTSFKLVISQLHP